MTHYNFTGNLRGLWDKACARYSQGLREASALFSPDEQAFLAANGLTSQNLYDYAEDFTAGADPTWDTALSIELVRRDYFLNAQSAKPSSVVLDEAALPPKTAAIEGIEWLPRIIPKAKAKLRGELPSALMYCCGGDRRFFKTHDIQPAEFLSLVWRNGHSDASIVKWVVRRSKAPQP
jgi:hypothetical protein